MTGPEIVKAVLAIVGAYLVGAIPTAYIMARVLKGIDIRQFGSGNVGAANLVTQINKRIGLGAGVFDCLVKGTLLVVVARLLGLDIWVQISVGLAAVAGHNWSVYIGFTGGRGVATAVGVILGFLMWREFLVLAVVLGLVGWVILKDTGFWTFFAVLLLAPLAYLFQVYLDSKSPELVYMSLGLSSLVLAKRLTANWQRPPEGYSLLKVILYRLVLDRDVPRKVGWVKRAPRKEKGSSEDVDDGLPETPRD